MKRVIQLFPWRRTFMQGTPGLEHFSRSPEGDTIIRLHLDSPIDLLMPFERFPTNYNYDDINSLVFNLDKDLVNYLFSCLTEFENDEFILQFTLAKQSPPETNFSEQILRIVIHRYFSYLENIRRQNLQQLVRDAILLGFVGTGTLALSILLESQTVSQDIKIAFSLVNQGVTVFSWLTIWEALANALWNWRPLYQQMKICQRLQNARCELKNA
ncbi:hypothetical protein IQE94_09025 [Synechocystis sp. PCC 7339]|uniref:hypothetical protein n=1 Tax=Synechocystis TaxID=1142 RepID=UPI001880715F|nr:MULTISPECIES: hypothetical protein [Synechocystis]MBE9204701.1 hypothetical protein [Synechocystis salina LEGE 06099]QUS62151.1 hypothetical protein HTZ78_16790 [Synechocystis sp. PCC 7338]UAJ71334.1 hypothetical protein IQE94_09025 [Synechocystis sp. PCC 7339]